MASDGADEPARPSELVAFAQVRAMLGVGRSRAQAITAERRFPAPWFVSEDGTTRLWRRREVEDWLDRNRTGWRDTPPAS